MEASLLQFYAPRDPLREVLTGQITIRQFKNMCDGIPRTPESPVGRAINGPWSDRERLLHAMASDIRELLSVTYNSNRKPGAEPYRPKKVPAPPLTRWQKKVAKKSSEKKRERQQRPEEQLLAVLARNQQLNM